MSWTGDGVGVTIGNFYDQFGSGMIFRAYEERQLGIDNSMDGIRLTYEPKNGIYLKGMIGKQRFSFQDKLINGNGIIRAFDGELNLNELLDSSNSWKLKATLGGSFVSKFNTDNNTTLFNMPKNVGATCLRMNLRYHKIRFSGEYVHKINDPYPDQNENFNYIYKNGEGILLNLGYSTKGFAIDFSAKHMDNMLWRSTNVNVGPTDLLIGYLPALTKQHTYNLAATLYPYATNFYGEIAYQLDVLYKIPKKTVLGGRYGTSIAVNFATAHAPERKFISDMSTSRNSYTNLFLQNLIVYYFKISISK